MTTQLLSLKTYTSYFYQPKPPSRLELGREYCGHVYQKVAEGFQDLAKITGVTEGLQYICRSGVHLTGIIQPKLFLEPARLTMWEVDSYINAVRIFYDMNYFVGHRFAHDLELEEWARIGYNAFFSVTDACCALSFAAYLQLMDTAEYASKIGNFSVFGVRPLNFIQYTPLSTVCLTTASAAYLLMGIDALIRMNEGDQGPLTVTYLARAVAELAYRVFLVFGQAALATTTATVVGSGLGLIASGLALHCVYLQTQGFSQMPRYRMKR